MIRRRISMALRSGRADQTHAAMPAMSGQAKLVPLPYCMLPSLGWMIQLPSPTAHTSGFTRPSLQGPLDEKDATTLSLSTAPTHKILSAAAGAGR